MGLAVTKQEEFWEACGFGNTERVRKLIAEGIDVNWVSYTVRYQAWFISISAVRIMFISNRIISNTEPLYKIFNRNE